jgi:hypothetical protein
VRDERHGAGHAIPWDAVRDARVREDHTFGLWLHEHSRYLVNNGRASTWMKVERFFVQPDILINPVLLDRPKREVMQALLAHHDASKRTAIARTQTTAVIPPSTNSN